VQQPCGVGSEGQSDDRNGALGLQRGSTITRTIPAAAGKVKSEACPREGLPSHVWFLPVGTFLWPSLASILDPRLGTESSAQSAEKGMLLAVFSVTLSDNPA
jgi:hypothetical protein